MTWWWVNGFSLRRGKLDFSYCISFSFPKTCRYHVYGYDTTVEKNSMITPVSLGDDNINVALGYKIVDTSIFKIMSCPLLCLLSDCEVILICCSFQCHITLHHSFFFLFFFLCSGLQISCWILSGPIKRGQSHSQPLINQQEQSFLCLCYFTESLIQACWTF